MIDSVIYELEREYPSILFTSSMKDRVRKEFLNTSLSYDELKGLLIRRVEDYIVRRNSAPKFMPLSDMATYHIQDKQLHLHLAKDSLIPYMKKFLRECNNNKAQARVMYKDFLRNSLSDALRCSCNILEDNDDIMFVRASSQLVDKTKDVFVECGFSLGKYSDDDLSHIFPNKSAKEREAFRTYAVMSRDNVLSNYRDNARAVRSDNLYVRRKTIDNNGYVNSYVLLLLGVMLLCFLFMEFTKLVIGFRM